MKKRHNVCGLVAMLTSMAILGCACGKKDVDGIAELKTEESAVEADHIYKISDVDIDFGANEVIRCSCQTDSGIYVLLSAIDYNEEDYKDSNRVINISDENSYNEIKIPESEGMGYHAMAADDDGNLYFSENIYNYRETDEELGEDDYLVPEQYVLKVSNDGEVMWRVRANEDSKDDPYGIKSLKFVKDLGLVALSKEFISVFDPDSGKETHLNCDDMKTDVNSPYSTRNLYVLKHGKIYLIQSDENMKDRIYAYDPAEGFSEKTDDLSDDVRENLTHGRVFTGANHDFLVCSDDGIKGFNLDDDKTEKICDFVLSDIALNGYDIDTVMETRDGELIALVDEFDQETHSSSSMIYRLTKTDPSDIKEKAELTLATFYISENVRKAVALFNQNNDNCRIKIKDYSEYDSGDDFLYDKGIEQLNLDIVGGNAPDIMVLDEDIPFESYVQKGVLEALDDYMSNDEEISQNSYLQNIMDSERRDGKLYTIIPSFSIDTCAAAESLLGTDRVTFSNYKDICTKKNIDPTLMMGYLTREDTWSLYTLCIQDFVDRKNGTCDFESPGFYAVLEFIKSLPTTADEETHDSFYREKKALLLPEGLYGTNDYLMIKDGYIGESIVFNGYPVKESSVSLITPTLRLSMGSKCKDKEAAWQFIRYFLTDEYQTKLDWGFPVSEKAFDAMIEKSRENPYYIDENGEKHEYSSSIGVDDITVEVKALSETEAEQLSRLVKTATTTYSPDNDIYNIIEEEAGAYYEDQKSVEEVASIIQSRVSIYLSENS